MEKSMDLIKINLPAGLAHYDPQLENLEFILSISRSQGDFDANRNTKDDHFPTRR